MLARTWILSGFLLGGVSAFGAPSWFTYELRGLPRNVHGCAATATSLGESYKTFTGISIVRAGCEQDGQAGYDITLQYRAEEAYPSVSTSKEGGGFGQLGIYTTAAECQAALSSETDRFEKETGLRPFVSYCFRDSSISKTPYYVRVDGLGVAKKYPYRFAKSLYGNPVGDASAPLRALLQGAKAQGVDAYQAVFADDGSSKLVVRYYDEPDNLQHHSNFFLGAEMAKYSYAPSQGSIRYCQEQLGEARKAFGAFFKTPAVWFCAWDPMLFQARLYLLRVRPTTNYLVEEAPTRYAKFAECDGDRPAIAEVYKQSLGTAPIATLCHWDNGLFGGKRDAYVIRAVLPETN